MRKSRPSRTSPLSKIVVEEITDLAFMGGISTVEMLHVTSQWKAASPRLENWTELDFPPSNLSALPRSPGVYAFYLHPGLFGLPHATR